MNLIEKILAQHLISGNLVPGSSISLRAEQTLTQDALGMLAYMAFEEMGLPRVATELSVSYIDHNLLYADFRNPDDHAYLTSLARRFGITVSRAGNGICHSVHLARFAVPGKILVGTDSHTPSAGALGMLGLGTGGMDVALVMGGLPLVLSMPKVLRIYLTGQLSPGVNAKDAALELLRILGVKGGLGYAFEFSGPGIASLSIPERMTLTNLAVETGATTSIFPSDEVTHQYLCAQGREKDFSPLFPDADAAYAGTLELDLSCIPPMVALPHLPDNAVPVSQAEPCRVDQVFIGSCTNSSFADLMKAAAIFKGRSVAPNVSLLITPGTRQNYLQLLKSGAMEVFVRAGARVLECGCGPCVGIGQAVRTGGISVRTVNRNFKGRCGTKDSSVLITSPETAAATAVLGHLASADELLDPAELAFIREPGQYDTDDSMILHNLIPDPSVSIVRGPNIGKIPGGEPLPDSLVLAVTSVLGDNVSTDEIAPAGAKNVANRANIEEVSKSAFERIDPNFWQRTVSLGQTMIVAGENYGQGSSREHAALMPRHLGVRAVLALSYARIHRTNLINFGILPLTLERSALSRICPGDRFQLSGLHDALETGHLLLQNLADGQTIPVSLHVSAYEREVLRAGSVLQYIKNRKEVHP